MHFEIKDDKIYLYNCFEHLQTIQQMPGRKWHKKQRAWSLSYDIDTVLTANERLPINIPLKTKNVLTANDSKPIIQHLYKHQLETVYKMRQNECFADLSEPGSGKTLVQINMMLERDTWPILIICPKSIMSAVWQEQLVEINIQLKRAILFPILLTGGSKKIIKTLDIEKGLSDKVDGPSGKVFIINYESVPLVLDELLAMNFPYVILDESTKIKNRTAKRSKACIKLKEHAKYRSIMTGTVAPNGVMDMFNQFNFVDSYYFGTRFYAFRERYFYPGFTMTTKQGQEFQEWFLKSGSLELIKARIADISIQHHKRDCVDLPPLVHEKRLIEMNTEQAKIYRDMKEELLIQLEGQVITAKFAMTKMMKLRQIASGFIYDEEDTYRFYNSKLNEMIELVDEINNKVIIFAHFKESLINIANKLTGYLEYKTNLPEDDKMRVLETFETSEQHNILIANPISAGHGLNLQFCSNIIYYEKDFNLETYLQSVQRIERIGQKNKMTVYHLMAKNTIDEYIHKKLMHKEDINKELDLKELKELI